MRHTPCRGDALPILEEDRDAYNAHIQALGVAPEAELDHRVLLPDGSVRWLHWMSRAICDADRVTVELQSVGRDITAQKTLHSERASTAPSPLALPVSFPDTTEVPLSV